MSAAAACRSNGRFCSTRCRPSAIRASRIDTSQIRFRTASRDIVLIDAPGHAEFLRNMITGAAQADAALLIIDAAEGVRDQTRRHGYLLHLLGIHQVAVVINKMDRVDFDETRFHEIEAEIVGHLSSFGLSATAIIPISARNGDGVARRTPSIAWHTGPTVLEVLDRSRRRGRRPSSRCAFPVQAVYKFDDRRIIAGRVETGRIAVGDEIVIMPRGTTARVLTIEAWPVPDESRAPREADAGQSVGITLDREVFVDRGDLISTAQEPSKAVAPAARAGVLAARQGPRRSAAAVNVRIGMAECRGAVALIDNAVDPGALSAIGADAIGQNHVGEIEIALSQPIAADTLRPQSAHRAHRARRSTVGSQAAASCCRSTAPYINAPLRQRRRMSLWSTSLRTTSPPRRRGSTRSWRRCRQANASRASAREVAGKIVFTTSFGLEDQVIMHLLCERALDVEIVDPRYRPAVSRDLCAVGRNRAPLRSAHSRRLSAARRSRSAGRAARHQRVLQLARGPHRLLPCPQGRAAGARARAAPTAGSRGCAPISRTQRQAIDLVTVDAERKVLKLSPLLDWTRDAVHAFATSHDVPINPLHARGFASIGCAPCTRAIAPGEPERAGRWWWEQDDKKECGLHSRPPGSR